MTKHVWGGEQHDDETPQWLNPPPLPPWLDEALQAIWASALTEQIESVSDRIFTLLPQRHVPWYKRRFSRFWWLKNRLWETWSVLRHGMPEHW